MIEDARTAGEAAALWWEGSLRNVNRNVGEDDPNIASLAKLPASNSPAHSKEGLIRFRRLMMNELDGRLRNLKPDKVIQLRVDRRPDGVLRGVANQAGLVASKTGDWQWFTLMEVGEQEVTVRDLRLGVTEVIWRNRSGDEQD